MKSLITRMVNCGAAEIVRLSNELMRFAAFALPDLGSNLVVSRPRCPSSECPRGLFLVSLSQPHSQRTVCHPPAPRAPIRLIDGDHPGGMSSVSCSRRGANVVSTASPITGMNGRRKTILPPATHRDHSWDYPNLSDCNPGTQLVHSSGRPNGKTAIGKGLSDRGTPVVWVVRIALLARLLYASGLRPRQDKVSTRSYGRPGRCQSRVEAEYPSTISVSLYSRIKG